MREEQLPARITSTETRDERHTTKLSNTGISLNETEIHEYPAARDFFYTCGA